MTNTSTRHIHPVNTSGNWNEIDSYWGVFDFDGNLVSQISGIITSRRFLSTQMSLSQFEPNALDWRIRCIWCVEDGWIARAACALITEHYIDGPSDADELDDASMTVEALFRVSTDFEYFHAIGLLPRPNDDERETGFAYGGICFGALGDYTFALPVGGVILATILTIHPRTSTTISKARTSTRCRLATRSTPYPERVRDT